MASTDASGPRLVGLDRLRGAALLLMLVHHLTGWFGRDPRRVLPGWDGFAVTAVAVRVAPRALPVVAAVTLLAAAAAERAGRDAEAWVAEATLTGTFPLVAYLGFALLGAACAPLLGHARERKAALAVSGIGIAWTIGLVLVGDVPDRYPGDASFLVPGITGTGLLYLAVTSPRLDDAGRVGSVIRRAGAHTFGIFVGHYAIYLALRETGLLHERPDVVALVAAVVTAVSFTVLAARMPKLPWSPRTGWARPRSTPPALAEAPTPVEQEPVASARSTARCG